MTPSESKAAGAGTNPHIKVEWLSHFAQLCRASKVRYEGTYQIPFCDEWFSLPTNEYNPGLAYAGMGICLSGYKNLPSNGYKYILGSLDACGFEDVDITSYYHLNDENYIAALDNVNVISYAIAHRMINTPEGKKVPLVVIMVRGTSVSIEWNSNSNVANTVADGKYDVAYHEGFKKSSDGAYATAQEYIRSHGLNTPDARLWIIAHSRGATIANVLASTFDEDPDSGFDKDHIYAYTFSSSPTTRRADANGPSFDNIFNLVNPEDYIPRIPPSSWEFKRFGRDVYLPSICTNYSDYREYREEFLKRFKEWTRVDFPAFHGFAETNYIDRMISSISPGAADMYQHKRYSHFGTLTFAQYFRIFTDLAGHRGFGLDEDAGKLGKYGVGTFDHFLAYFMANQVLGHNASGAHQEEGYLLKLMLCYAMDIDIMAPAGTNGPDYDPNCYECDTERFTVNGPVDVMVLDGEGRVVASIGDGKVDDQLCNHPYFISMYYEKLTDTSQVWIPGGEGNGEYTLELVAREDGNYDCAWAKQAPMGQVVEQRFYADVPLKKDDRVKWADIAPSAPTKVVKAPEDAGCGYCNTGEECSLRAEVNVKAMPGADKKLPEGMAFASSLEHGDHIMPVPAPGVVADALAARCAAYGEHVFVQAYHDKKIDFVGWFEEGADPTKDEPVSTDERYVFRIEGNRSLDAYFDVK